MKLCQFFLVFVFGLVGLSGMTNGLCLVSNSSEPNRDIYHCFRVVDYSSDLNKAPADVYRHFVTNSKIKVIRNRSYSSMSKTLVCIAVLYCGVEEIEDNAFQGLDKLTHLGLLGNKLTIIKSAWFKGLSRLRVVSFQDNQIKHVDDNFFAILPPILNVLDISNNKLTCLPTSSFGNFKTTEFYFRHNRFTWKCRILIMDWLKNTKIYADWIYIGNVDPPYELAKNCVTKSPSTPLDEEFLNKCVEETARELLPPNETYTVKQVCQFLKDKPSPFLDCTK